MIRINGIMRPDSRVRDYQLVDEPIRGSKNDHEWIDVAVAKLNRHGVKVSWTYDGDCYYLGCSPFPCVEMVKATLVARLRELLITRRHGE